MRGLIRNLVFMVCGIVLALLVGEGIIRIATMDQQNYVIEMWRYAKLLKERSSDPEIGHQHIPNRSAILQNVEIKTNQFGMRGPEPNFKAVQRVAIVGDSLALGWGVSDEQSLRGQLAKVLPTDFDVVNAGVGNMNLNQSVTLWRQISQQVSANILVVCMTPRASANVVTEAPGWLVQHSELAALASTFAQQLVSGEYGEAAMIKGYQEQWQSPAGHKILTQAFNQLQTIKQNQHSRIIIVSIPEMHDFNQYQFGFMEDKAKQLAAQYGFDYIDPLPSLKGKPASSYWVSPRDIHLNGSAFKIITQLIIDDINRGSTQ
ncbi:SGNH/GDSL hydrolase family protein [Celerinatantimonas sp. YJH-8]|uniref:SGNH/GDSL hydrolase family protein n=1 Tax=Celerinatantimonas sp. YJH-8 TaxID=3228714 RepID=UPI0038C2A9EE